MFTRCFAFGSCEIDGKFGKAGKLEQVTGVTVRLAIREYLTRSDSIAVKICIIIGTALKITNSFQFQH